MVINLTWYKLTKLCLHTQICYKMAARTFISKTRFTFAFCILFLYKPSTVSELYGDRRCTHRTLMQQEDIILEYYELRANIQPVLYQWLQRTEKNPRYIHKCKHIMKWKNFIGIYLHLFYIPTRYIHNMYTYI